MIFPKVSPFDLPFKNKELQKSRNNKIFTSQGMEVENRKRKELGRFSIERRKLSGIHTEVLALI